MSADAEVATQLPNGSLDDNHSVEDDPVTPLDNDNEILAPNSPLPSTEAPPSPIDDPNASFKTEFNDDRLPSSAIIPSSLTPPPSSQVPSHARNGVLPSAYIGSHRSTLFSPPATGLATFRPAEAALATDYVPPAPQQVLEATADELRAMVQTCIAEQAKLKMEAAHHKLQYNLLSLQADEDSKRAEVEFEMMRREVDALRTAEYSQHARRELSAATESAQLKYLQMKTMYEDAVEENRALNRRFKMAKKLVSQKEEEIASLAEERDMLLNRIRENREHFTMLCNPGGMFHGAVTPTKATQSVSTPQQVRVPARQTPKTMPDVRTDPAPGQESMAALLQALSQDNNSAPSTPIAAARPVPRLSSKHTRNAQSLSSLPTTPGQKPRGDHVRLLPSVDLVPQTEPPARYSNRQFAPPSPTPRRERTYKSRESTISVVDDNEELARQALESVAKSASFLSQASRGSQRGPRRPLPNNDEEDEEAFASQASKAASEMLRRDPRESFEIAREARSGTPAAAEKGARLQAKLLSGTTKTGAEKRKFSGGVAPPEDLRQMQAQASPPKKLRVSTQAGDGSSVGLGIQYGQQ
ncbi:hypothetical protein ACHAQH_005067 [Verticillium albo-atrum]